MDGWRPKLVKRRLRAVTLVCALGLVGAGCTTAGHGGMASLTPFHAQHTATTRTALHKMLVAGAATPLQREIRAFYAARDFRPVWTGSDRALARAALVTFTLSHAYRQGLDSANYPVDAARARAQPTPGVDAAKYDLTLTRSVFEYVHDVHDGRVDPNSIYNDVKLPAHHFDVRAALTAAIENDAIDPFLDSLPPMHPQYRRLAAALSRYRAIAARGGWHRLSARTATGARLVKRLDMEDPALAKIAHPSPADVKAAVKRFQQRHGLGVDGQVGPATLKALNVPVLRRMEEIEANMERWRWMPRDFASTYIRVNVPDQSVDFIHDGKSVLHSKVVIGEPNNTTPILVTRVDAVIANPYWDIPDDISAKALVPHLRRNANYLKTRNMVLVNAPAGDRYGTKINWRKVTGDVLPYQIRQEPGPHNALGKVMLDMPNEFYVYLHDTPAKYLFTLSDRERSHGCVRVEKIVKLAELTLASTDAKPDKKLTDAIDTQKTQRLTLARPLPVYMEYWTASVGKNGAVDFHPDLYGRDKPLIARLEGKAPPPKPILRSAALTSDGDIGP